MLSLNTIEKIKRMHSYTLAATSRGITGIGLPLSSLICDSSLTYWTREIHVKTVKASTRVGWKPSFIVDRQYWGNSLNNTSKSRAPVVSGVDALGIVYGRRTVETCDDRACTCY